VVKPGTRITLLGKLSIDHRGEVFEPDGLLGRRAELVFAMLAAEHDRAVSRDELADALWPELLPDSWAAAVRGIVSEVRRYLDRAGLEGSDMLRPMHSGYRLRLPPGIAVDVDEVRDGLAQARAQMAAGEYAEAASRAEWGADQAKLPFLPSHESEWADTVRTNLVAIHVASLEVQVQALAQARDLRGAARAAERLVRAEPYSEAAHQLRIRVLGDAGDQAGAMQAYEQCRATLESELGIAPSAETESTLREALARASTGGSSEREQTDTRDSAAADAGLSTYSVLVVEDHDFQRRTAIALLRALGVASVTDATDGRAALELLAQSPSPDIIICDIDMPGMDGVEFVRHLAELGVVSGLIVCSGLDRGVLDAAGLIGESYGLQLLGVVQKPLTRARLQEFLASYRRPINRPADEHGAGGATDDDVAAALAEGQLMAHFQPVVDLASGAPSGVELMPRWSTDSWRPFPPPWLGATGYADATMVTLFEHTLRSGCAGLARADVSALSDYRIAIRLPDACVADVSLADRLSGIVSDSGWESNRCDCVTGERGIRSQGPVALDVLTRLRVKGFGLYLDGTGRRQMTVEEVRRLPLTGIWLTAEIVTNAVEDRRRVEVLRAALDLAAGSALQTVGTGCDSPQDFELLLSEGCAFAQGAFIGDPLALPDLADFSERWKAPSPAGGQEP
jgi:DNA-binding SARP family transcriptional activator/EAL domain-containing protein (putative c-di-GMP-specific phosphodiesterase class I)/CheY-like chemotaxis protein